MKVLGIIEAWGRVEVHDSGFRAEFARPVALVLRPEDRSTDWGQLTRRLAHIYHVQVLVLSEPGELATYCSSRAPGLSSGVIKKLLARPQTKPADTNGGHSTLPTGTQQPHKRTLRDWVTWVGVLITGLIVSLFYIAIGGAFVLGMVGAILGWFDSDSRSATAVARGHLEVVDQAVLGRASRDPIYVALVKNDDPQRAALGVAPRLRVNGVDGSRAVAELARSGSFDHRANVPPGGAAVAFDHLPVVPSGSLREPRFQVAAFRRAVQFPIKRVAARLDRGECRLSAEVGASQPLRDLRLIGLARHGRRIVGGGTFRIDSVPAGRSHHRLPEVAEQWCDPQKTRWSLHPAVAPSRGRWR